jgi:hypothetical protein
MMGESAMSSIGQRSNEELKLLGKRADEVFTRSVKPKLRPEDDGKFVAIDLNTSEFEIDEDDHAAMTRLEQRLPNAEIWLERAGSPTAYHIL